MSWSAALMAECLTFAATVLLIMAVTRKPRNRRLKKPVIRVPDPEFQPDRIGPWS